MTKKLKKEGSMPAATQRQRRRWTRFHPDVATEASVDTKYKKGKYTPTHSAIVLDEGFKGSCLVVAAPFTCTVGDTLWCKIGELRPMQAEIRWMEKVDDRIFKIGVFFLE